MNRITNFNAIEDLMAVNSGVKSKGEIFQKHQAEFREIFTQAEILEKKRIELNHQIAQNIGQFS